MRQLRQKLERLKGQREQLVAQTKELKRSSRVLSRDLKQFEEARVVIQTVAKLTQAELEYHISEIVTLALSAVFEDPYEFEIEFVNKRGKTEAEIWFVRNEQKIKPIDASGGGVVDVASFALRVALWNISRPRTRNTLILDEPGKFISANLHDRFSMMLKEISEKLGVQIVMVSHIEGLIENADKTFRVQMKNGVSQVTA